MTDFTGAIALVTPLKDERDNIDKFLSSIKNQTVPIKCLVIVENDSSDGSAEYLDSIASLDNVDTLKVIHMSFDDKSYRVGKKYATIIDRGMQWLKQQDFYDGLDFVGILDCDVFPEIEYYEKLTHFLNQNPEIGITSGLIYTPEGVLHIANPNFVRGGCRLWKKSCLDEAGYRVVYTADTVSMALAHLHGWKTRTLKSASLESREVNVRIANSRNKGYHAYFRGHTLFYVILKALHFTIAKKRPKLGMEYLQGYVESLFKRKERIEDPAVRKYFRFYLINKLTNKYK